MEFKPSDIFVGIVDFFAILLPGSVLAARLTPWAADNLLGPGKVFPRFEGEAAGWAIFLVGAYLCGQIVSLIGAFCIDGLYDRLYLPFKTRESCKNGKRDAVYGRAAELVGDAWKITSLKKWAATSVRLRSPEAALEIDRLEATSKFFRALVIVLALCAVSFIWDSFSLFHKGDTGMSRCLAAAFPQRDNHVVAGLCVIACRLVGAIALLFMSFWRYSDQRWKSTELAFLCFILLHDQQPAALKATD